MITTTNLTFGYKAKQRVLSDITMELQPGHIHGLLGCNGIGKTTLLKIVCGIMRPNSGSVVVNGVNPFDRSPELLREIMFIPEEFDLPNLSLEKYAKITAPFYPKFDVEAMRNNCNELEVDPRTKLHSLSMGQRKKAYIAFALACNTNIVLMDEPTNGIDIPSKRILRSMLAKYANDSRTIVISTHQVADVEYLLDNIVILDNKGVALNATTTDICSKLCFGRVEADDEVIYSESTIAGQMGVTLNRSECDSVLNIELLFNAVTAERDTFANLFK